MIESLVAQKYVKAIFSMKNSTLIQEFANTLNTLSGAISSSKEIRVALSSPLMSDSNKVDSLLSAIGDNIDKSVDNFIKLLGENGRLDLIPEISRQINTQLQKQSNNYQGLVYSSKKLNKTDMTQLEKTLSKHTGSNITLEEIKSDIDGIKVLVDDLGIEVNFSKKRVKEQLIDFINQAF